MSKRQKIKKFVRWRIRTRGYLSEMDMIDSKDCGHRIVDVFRFCPEMKYLYADNDNSLDTYWGMS